MKQFYLLGIAFLAGAFAALAVVGSVPGSYGMVCVVVVLALLGLLLMLAREYYLLRAYPQRRKLRKKRVAAATVRKHSL